MSVPRLRAPKEHEQILAVPAFDQVGALLDRNRHKLSSTSFAMLGKSLDELRSLARREILALSTKYHHDAGEPLPPSDGAENEANGAWLVAGHQPELFHPGVWFKNFALDALAKKHKATAVNLIVDTDSAKPALLHVPAGNRMARLTFDRSTQETPYEERIVEDEPAFASLPEQLAPFAEAWGFEPMLPTFWREVMEQAKHTPLLGERFAGARRALERRWGVVQREAPMSRVCATEAFALFACSIVRELPRFHALYNETVRAYRLAHRIRSHSHPVPDLAADGEWLEAPFWAWRAGRTRRGKLFVKPTPETWHLRVSGEDWPSLAVDDAAGWCALQTQGFKIRPRALTTTMFARLCLANVFLHGIGGGIYDELTDRIIEGYFGVPAPGFMIVSATLLLPLARFPHAAQRQRDLAREARDLIFKPELFSAASEATAPLVHAKADWIARTGATHAERVERFRRIRETNTQLGAPLAQRMQQVREATVDCARQLEADAVAARRDYAFCLYPEAMLRAFMTRDRTVLPF